MTESQASRTRAFLRQLARGQEVTDAMFAPGRVVIVLGRDEAGLAQSQLTLSFAVNLMARLYPVIQRLDVVVPLGVPLTARPPRWFADTAHHHIWSLLHGIRPLAQWDVRDDPPSTAECVLIVGSAHAVKDVPSVFVGSDGWQVAISPTEPQAVGHAVNPVGAYAAACFGVSEVWKRLLQPHRELLAGTPIFPLEETLHFSALTYCARPHEPNPRIPEGLSLGRLTMVGLGAGGGAAAFTLASLSSVEGALNLIEPDVVEASNLNRYVFCDANDAATRRLKTAVVRNLFGHSPDLSVNELSVAYRDAVEQLSVEDFRHVLAAVHSREARRDIQWETPMVLWDAAAAEGEFGIWRMIQGQTECMWCKHPPDGDDPERAKAQQLANLVGLDLDAWLRKVRDNDPFTADEISSLHLPSDAEFELPSVGQRYGDWERDQCGRLMFPATETSVPVPFAPVLAGVLEAGEVIKEHALPDNVLDSRYWNTLLGRFMTRSVPTPRRPRDGCRICDDPDLGAQYERRWRTPESQTHPGVG